MLGPADVAAFALFFLVVVGVSLYMSRRQRDREGYFLAGRSLTWWLIGLSIVAANISTEQFVGMAGQGAGSVGLAVSNWQLVGSVGIVLIAFTLLPRFLRAGLYTIPEFLEYRYNAAARSIMALCTVVIYVAVLLTAVLYSGGLTLRTIFGIDLRLAVWCIGLIAAVYTTLGGLKAVAWADLFQGLALLLGGMVLFVLGLRACGGWESFAAANGEKLHMVLPASHEGLPWTGVAAGMWIVILYYCGLNQFIVQRNLAARTLRHGQLGMIFAGALWLLVPFVIVMPGIMSHQLYGPEMAAAAAGENDRTLEAYESLKASGRNPDHAVFGFDDAWREAHPGKAEELEAFNAQARRAAEGAGRPVRPQKALVQYKYDAAFPIMLKRQIPAGLRGFMFAAIAGAVISSLASMLNSAATIFTLDVYHRLIQREASPARLVWLGRILTAAFLAVGCLAAPSLDDPKYGGVFQFIQQFQGYIWPGVVAAFVFGLWVPKAPAACGAVALISGPLIYGLLQWGAGDRIHFLLQVALTFGVICLVLGGMTLLRPLREPKKLPVREDVDVRTSPAVYWAGALVIAAVAVFYAVFR